MPEDRKPLVSLIYPELQDQAAAALGRAFVDDPMFRAVIPEVADPERRAAILREMFGAMFVVERKTGQPTFGVICDGKVVAAAATEGAGRPSTFDVTTAGLGQTPRMLRALGRTGLQRAFTLFRILSSSHPPEPHLYLQALGVDPDYQKRHFGVALLEHLREQAQAHPDVTGVYLETAKEANLAYYGARGYQIIGEIHPLGVRTWRMYQRVRG
jgi:ribosomal protein S18 acetylase RimI-like enzyme